MNNLITRSNYELLSELNQILKDSSVEKRITIKIIDNIAEFGVIVSIPSIIYPEKDSFEISIIEDFKNSELSLIETIDSINNDIKDLLNVIKPDYIKLSRIKEAFDYRTISYRVTDNNLDNFKVFNYNIFINEIYDRHQN